MRRKKGREEETRLQANCTCSTGTVSNKGDKVEAIHTYITEEGLAVTDY